MSTRIARRRAQAEGTRTIRTKATPYQASFSPISSMACTAAYTGVKQIDDRGKGEMRHLSATSS